MFSRQNCTGEHCDFSRVEYKMVMTPPAPSCNYNSAPFSTKSQTILSHFAALKMGILKEMKLMSSLQERVSEGVVLSCSSARTLSSEYLSITEEFLSSMRKIFEERIAQTVSLQFSRGKFAEISEKF